MKMSEMFKQIIALMLANDVKFVLHRGEDCYFLSTKDKNGEHIWEIDDSNDINGGDREEVIYWDKDYYPYTFLNPITYVRNAHREGKSI